MLELILRLDKGAALTHQEMDTNLQELAKVNLSPGIPCVGITDADKGKLVMFDDSDNLAKLYERSPAVEGKLGKYSFSVNSTTADVIDLGTYGFHINPQDYQENATTKADLAANLANYFNTYWSTKFTATATSNVVTVVAKVFPQANQPIQINGSNISLSVVVEPKPAVPTMPHRVILGVVAKVEDSKVYCYDNTVLEVVAGEDINVPTGASIEDLQARVFPRLLFADDGGVATIATPAHLNIGHKSYFGVAGVVGFALHSAKAGEKVLVRRLL